MNRTSIINYFIKKIQAKSYLEIGISDGANFRQIHCDKKVGVDPALDSPATIHLTSDDFFARNTDYFDVVFIDGWHQADQVKRDILNSLTVLNTGGVIICHDMNPLTEIVQMVPRISLNWNGDCWRAFVELRQTRTDLEMFTIDCDEGVSVIKKGQQELLNVNVDINYDNFSRNRNEWLNLISVDEFTNSMNIKTNSNNPLISLLEAFIYDPASADNNFALALYYNNIGQTASAVSYYIRTAERTDDDLLKYECLIKAARCFEIQGTRSFSVKGLLQHAIALIPTRPEAYFFLSRLHEIEQKEGDWFQCYMLASIGLGVCEPNPPKLRTDIGYPGTYGLLFEKAVSSWWCGLCEESRSLFKDLLINYDLDTVHRTAVLNNLKFFNEFNTKKLTLFTKDKHDQLRLKFPGSDTIETNHSESYQDMFVLTMLNGKRNGHYLEIGAGNSFYGNNTALLEQKFDWKGISLDIDQQFIEAFTKDRRNPCLLKDATTVNYEKFLSGLDFPTDIDYLQLDCDPPDVTYKILLSLPFEKYKFAVITYEHDYYCDETKSFRDKSRKYLESFGYILVAGDIAPDEWRNYEDWWIHPDLIDKSILDQMLTKENKTKKAEQYMLSDKK